MRSFVRGLASCVFFLLVACGSKEQQPAVSADDEFAKLEHEYVVYFLSRFPVVATYLGGAAFDDSLKDIDGKLRDHSVDALKAEDAALQSFQQRFAALDETKLSPRRRIDRNVATAQIAFLLRQ